MSPMWPEDSFSKGAVRSTILQIVFLHLTIGHALSCPTNQANYLPSTRKEGSAPSALCPVCQPAMLALGFCICTGTSDQALVTSQLTFPEQLHAVIEKIFLSSHLNVSSSNFITDPFGLLLTNDLCSVTGEKIK